MGDADDGEDAGGDENAAFAGEFVEAEEVVQDAGALFFDEEMDLELIFKAQGFLVVAGGVDAREAERRLQVVECH